MSQKKQSEGTDLVQLKNEINEKIGDQETFETLLKTTFEGMEAQTAKRAMLEGVMRGFKFDDFLQKNVYAIPFNSQDGQKYSLITSIDYARKIGQRSGVVGKSKPEFEQDEEGKIISCTITIKKKVGEQIGEYTDTVYFDEYYKAGKNGKPSLWDTKPRTMIAKVAEMHALRQACPEELSQAYAEEEYQSGQFIEVDAADKYEETKKAIENSENTDYLEDMKEQITQNEQLSDEQKEELKQMAHNKINAVLDNDKETKTSGTSA